MILVRNCPHDNGIYTLEDDFRRVVIKSSCSVSGVARLRNEYAGYAWYFRQKNALDKHQHRILFNDNGRYARLYTELFPGEPGIYHRRLSYNKTRILRVINAYAEVWPARIGKLAPLHGDFSLGNIIFHGNDLVFIDWEHFQPDAAPWGFDLVNLLYESAFFSLKEGCEFSRSDRRVFAETRETVCALLDPKGGFKCTLENLTQFIFSNAHIWKDSISKLPVMKFTVAQKEYLKQFE